MPYEIHEDKIVMRAGQYELKKPWVGLTDKDTDVSHLAYSGRSTDYIDGYAAGMEAAEDKLKEKNA